MVCVWIFSLVEHHVIPWPHSVQFFSEHIYLAWILHLCFCLENRMGWLMKCFLPPNFMPCSITCVEPSLFPCTLCGLLFKCVTLLQLYLLFCWCFCPFFWKSPITFCCFLGWLLIYLFNPYSLGVVAKHQLRLCLGQCCQFFWVK